MSISAMSTFYVSGIEERPYFCDYEGFCYRADVGDDDYPLNVQTAIDSYYYTNWRDNQDLVDQKSTPHVYINHQISSSVLTFAYSYEYNSADQYTQSIDISAGTSVYGSAVYGTAKYATVGGSIKRRDLDGRGRVVRFKFANNTLDETWQLDALGTLAQAETHV